MTIETTKPKTPEKAPKIKYKLPINLWFVENNQREIQAFSKKNMQERKETGKVEIKKKGFCNKRFLRKTR